MTEMGVKLAEEIERRGISKRQAARQIGVTHITVIQATFGREFNFYPAYRVCKWLRVPYSSAVNSISVLGGATFVKLCL